MENIVRLILKKHSAIGIEADTLDATANLYDQGLTSFSAVQVMLGLEEVLAIEFSDEFLTRQTFQTIGALTSAVETLRGHPVIG